MDSSDADPLRVLSDLPVEMSQPTRSYEEQKVKLPPRVDRILGVSKRGSHNP